MKENDKELLHRIARYLMLHASFTSSPGLLNGKMGIAWFFYHYFRYTRNKNHDNFAGLLLDEVCAEIHRETPLNFREGLCGIGWAIAYLIRNKFVRADPNETLEELDRRIVEWDVRKIADNSLETGLKGIACYVISRRQNSAKDNPFFTQAYWNDLKVALNGNMENPQTINDLYNPVSQIVSNIKFNAAKLFEVPYPIGIENAGYTVIGLKMMEAKIG
jgi:hypothetical protein